ncbi:MAG: glycine--tRNA ligase subunit beta [Alphaproteobacteria bacterium TMED89]|nr:glycine--tRNA ligase subunit beta [Rhodospirillaceae bacterium]RPH17366.1 MAG: glycine--tRNA ligase subunit beta [Alphaproteobacteria bacterium TMED89]
MSATETLLIDLFSEEIPARMQKGAANDLAKSMADALKAEGLSVGAVDVWYAPRHIALRIADIPVSQADRSEERRGPREGAPEQAVAGFLTANGLASLDQAELRETPKGNFYFAVQHIKGQQTLDLLPGLIEKSIRDFTWPKSMRWGRGSFRWVRPLHRIVALFGNSVVPGALDLGNGESIPFGRETEGHRFSGSGAIALSNPATFEDQLREGSVVVNPTERAETILTGARQAAHEVGCVLIEDAGLLSEVTGLVEWPTIVRGQIPDRFMAVPKEVLVLSMKEHQKYFALQQPDGTLAPYFITVADGKREAETFSRIAGGNERVLAARLSDAEFFWNQDRRDALDTRVPALSSIVFHAKLGSVGDRSDRMGPLAAWLSSHITGADRDAARSAARLSKADLTTGMVGEFPELQGVMGAYYATHDGEDAAIAQAISEHYSPLGPNDNCPSAPLSVAVALADKIDALVGFWRIDEKPTGSKDPFALRRAALGVVRLLVENDIRIPLVNAFREAEMLYGGNSDVSADLLGFIADRMKVTLKDRGLRHDWIAAVFEAGASMDDDLVRVTKRVEALRDFVGTDSGTDLLAGYRRAANILRAEAKKAKGALTVGSVDASLFDEPAERALHAALAGSKAGEYLAAEDFGATFGELAKLRAPIDDFFESVMVNADVAAARENRLALLSQFLGSVDSVVRLSALEG